MPDTQKTILIDGYNLGLEKGTGVATYARNLSYEVRDLGTRSRYFMATMVRSIATHCCVKFPSSMAAWSNHVCWNC